MAKNNSEYNCGHKNIHEILQSNGIDLLIPLHLVDYLSVNIQFDFEKYLLIIRCLPFKCMLIFLRVLAVFDEPYASQMQKDE